MRAGVFSVQQTLTAEASNMVKQSIGLARRRGHAQVTPLHVASALLASPNGLLRRACLQSHSHPLQFRALELCFNVALNRLPAFTSNPLLGPQSPHHHHPSLSNALVAAFKRAQAHQRRGTIENQQQPILALKIELQHLIISILDDPSVSRVMREAGFSSPQVKTKLEQTVSLEICSQVPSTKENPISKPQVVGPNVSNSQFLFGSSLSKPADQNRNQNMSNVLNTIVNKRRNTVIIGECVGSAESVVKGVMDRFEKGQVSGDLRYLQFIKLPLFSLRNLAKDEVEQKLVELKCLVKNYIGRGVVLYLGDLKWISEFSSNNGEQRRNYYCPVEHIIMEIKRLVCGIRDSGKFFLLGISSFQTYIKCKTGYPSLETIWELHPLTISADSSLSLCLNLADSLPVDEAVGVNKNQTPLTHRLLNFDKEADQSTASSSLRNKDFISTAIVSSSSSLPSWLQEAKINPLHHKDSVNIRDVQKEHQFWISESEHTDELGYGVPLGFDPKPDLLSNPNSSPNSASSSEATEVDIDGLNKFKIRNAENMNILCSALERKVPRHKDLVPEIVSTILECRSGTRKVKSWLNRGETKEETWLFFLGADHEAKKKIARELGRCIFGSQNNMVTISSTSKTADLIEESNNKRKRDKWGSNYVERLGEALNENPHRVLLMEDMEQLDYCSMEAMKQAIENGRISISDGETVGVKDAIIIFSCKSLNALSRGGSSSRKRTKVCETEDEIKETDEMEHKNSSISLDLKIALEDYSAGDDIGIREYVDKLIVFRSVQEL
ncbi:hypothetical protein ERO13_A05G394900v2 [Gossypium hirsutum]|uniref:Protein SMAX1-LIKE 3 n=1 Tax=Gossypium hirsutum TaxID=3635 RepID=A0ABM3BTL4_GOSHI|nr:protein SMAX1-LIKE 3-like [Gossypium hirsutum]KAG4203342.1 hypothetical protein ERO13_A05G394900v2 [Gossypium hirsutum]